jgi:hypothetical protein
LKRSELVDFSPDYPRASLLLDHHNKPFHSLLPCLKRSNIPVWIYWGPLGTRLNLCGVDYLRPTNDEIGKAIRDSNQRTTDEHASQAALSATAKLAQAGPIILGGGEPDNGNYATPPTPSQQVPAPVPLSGQKHGETYQQYFIRMENIWENRLQTESEGARVARLSREAAQKNHPCPGGGSKAPVVWHWQEDDKTGFRLRTRVTRAMVPDIWGNYTNSQ